MILGILLFFFSSNFTERSFNIENGDLHWLIRRQNFIFLLLYLLILIVFVAVCMVYNKGPVFQTYLLLMVRGH